MKANNILYTQDYGEVSEWFKVQTWNVCVGDNSTAGSNPALSEFSSEKYIATKYFINKDVRDKYENSFYRTAFCR